jgi:restriction system protein
MSTTPYRVMLGAKSYLKDECIRDGYIGVHYDLLVDLTNEFPDNWRDFNARYVPYFLELEPGRAKQSAGLASAQVWTLGRGIEDGTTVIAPDGEGGFYVGTVDGSYRYVEGAELPHQRAVKWDAGVISQDRMGDDLRASLKAGMAVVSLERHADEIAVLRAGGEPRVAVVGGELVENPLMFAMEKHLEDFLIDNWNQTEIGKDFDILEGDDGPVGQQYPTDTGPIDILAISKDQKTLLIIELKKGRASDSVVGQAMRYMGFVKDELAEDGQAVKGVIVAADNDPRLKRALSMAPDISFYRYDVSFSLHPGEK